MEKAIVFTLASALSISAMAGENWTAIETQARGQTVYFNAWGGSEATNAYIDWAAKEANKTYGIIVRHVKVTDTAEVVKRVQTEVASGRHNGGSVDLMWVNGENFSQLKQHHLLFGPWAEQLPNWQYVDLKKPVQSDFSEPTAGLESPWGTAQLTFIANNAVTPVPPGSAKELLSFAKANPGRVTYPKPPDFHGTTFLKQLLSELTPDPALLQKPVSSDSFVQLTQPLWAYLDQLHPFLWRSGKAFPASTAEMHRMLADGELKLSMSFNPNEAANLITTRQLPPTTYSFGFRNGTIGNVHFFSYSSECESERRRSGFCQFPAFSGSASQKSRFSSMG